MVQSDTITITVTGPVQGIRITLNFSTMYPITPDLQNYASLIVSGTGATQSARVQITQTSNQSWAQSGTWDVQADASGSFTFNAPVFIPADASGGKLASLTETFSAYDTSSGKTSNSATVTISSSYQGGNPGS